MQNYIDDQFEVSYCGDRYSVTYTQSDYDLFQCSGDALNIYTYVMVKPDDFVFRRTEFINHLQISREKVTAGIKILKQAGLVETYPVRNKKGQIVGCNYKFYTISSRILDPKISKSRGPQAGTEAYKNSVPKPTTNSPKPTETVDSTERRKTRRPVNRLISSPEGGCKGGGRGATADSENAPETKSPQTSWSCERAPKEIPEPEPEIDAWDHIDRFLRRFPGTKTFQTFSDSGKKPHLTKIIHGEYVIDQLEALNHRGAGVFLTINETDGQGRSTDNIKRVRAVFVDLDGAEVAPVYDYKPHMVVESSPGKYHAYWLCTDAPLDGFKQIQEILADRFNGDTKVKDLPRVMRVPGFYHQKGKHFLSRIISEEFHDPLTFEELTNLFPPKPKKLWSKQRVKVIHHGDESEYKGPYGATKGDRNQSTARIIGGMIKRGLDWATIEAEAFKHGHACSPPLPDVEIAGVLKSCMRYA